MMCFFHGVLPFCQTNITYNETNNKQKEKKTFSKQKHKNPKKNNETKKTSKKKPKTLASSKANGPENPNRSFQTARRFGLLLRSGELFRSIGSPRGRRAFRCLERGWCVKVLWVGVWSVFFFFFKLFFVFGGNVFNLLF